MTKHLSKYPPLLQVEKIPKNFGGLQALTDVSFEVVEGEMLGLFGPNGSGTSTAFNVITGLLPASSGPVIFGGREMTSSPAPEVARAGVEWTCKLAPWSGQLTALDKVLAGFLVDRANFASR